MDLNNSYNTDYSNATYSPEEQVNAVWVLVSAAMVIFMQAGTAITFAASVR